MPHGADLVAVQQDVGVLGLLLRSRRTTAFGIHLEEADGDRDERREEHGRRAEYEVPVPPRPARRAGGPRLAENIDRFVRQPAIDVAGEVAGLGPAVSGHDFCIWRQCGGTFGLCRDRSLRRV